MSHSGRLFSPIMSSFCKQHKHILYQNISDSYFTRSRCSLCCDVPFWDLLAAVKYKAQMLKGLLNDSQLMLYCKWQSPNIIYQIIITINSEIEERDYFTLFTCGGKIWSPWNERKAHITYGWPRRIRCISNVLKRRLSSCHWNFKLYARDHAIVHLLYCFICWIHFLERNKSTAKIFKILLVTCTWNNKHLWMIKV